MSDKRQETADDIIAEMLGARTEFPFVYLMGEPDTPEVIDPKTKEIIEPRKINIRRVTVKELADRLKSALRRERGDCAKLREAVKAVVDVGYPHNFQREAPHIRGYCYDITRAIEKCFAALAALKDCPDIFRTSEAIRDEVLPKMAALRQSVDEAEMLTPERCWPFPSYGKLLFSVY